jgi:hypothetical protein
MAGLMATLSTSLGGGSGVLDLLPGMEAPSSNATPGRALMGGSL